MGRSSASARTTTITSRQLQAVKAVVEWYLRLYFRTDDDAGVPAMFCDPARVGAFAINADELRAGRGEALFRLLVATTMFQRRQDVQILRILRGIPAEDAAVLTDARRLLTLVDNGGCDRMRTSAALHDECDLTKDPRTRKGCCDANPAVACHLKRHTVLLKRYGHFGKVPTSAALMLRESDVADLASLRDAVLRRHRTRVARARALEAALSRAWRVSEKISAMFLSAVSNPDLTGGCAPWERGVDWSQFVVIDSNVDLFLRSIGYRGSRTYAARREFIQRVARRIDLRDLNRRVRSYNPRLVQQAMFLFMSAANRRALARDCMRVEGACARCPKNLATRCPVRQRKARVSD